jgi:hypothetical protein
MEMRVHQDVIEYIQIVDAAGALYQEVACSALVGKPLRLTELEAVFEGVATEELLELF